jgi:ribosome-associated heat shock protein Hsp15
LTGLSGNLPVSLRIDKWLWHARFFKTRVLCTKLVSSGIRVNDNQVSKPAFQVKFGDIITFRENDDIRTIEVVAIGSRRGPAPEAQMLYNDLDPPQPKIKEFRSENPKFEGKGRPTKKDRRQLAPFGRNHLD